MDLTHEKYEKMVRYLNYHLSCLENPNPSSKRLGNLLTIASFELVMKGGYTLFVSVNGNGLVTAWFIDSLNMGPSESWEFTGKKDLVTDKLLDLVEDRRRYIAAQ